MAKDNKNLNEKKPKFSPYWIYGIVLALFLGFQLINSGSYEDGGTITLASFLNTLKITTLKKSKLSTDVWLKFI